MLTITTFTKNHRFIMLTPFNRDFQAELKNIGGKWSPELKVWHVPEDQETAARHLMSKHFGVDGTETKDTPAKTVLVDLTSFQWDRQATVLGHAVARRWRRDEQPALVDGATIHTGSFEHSGGSHNKPLLASAGVVLAWEVPATLADRLVAEFDFITYE